MNNNKIKKKINDDYYLIAEISTDPEIPEIYIGIEDKNGFYIQDLTIVRPKYEYSKKDNDIKIYDETIEILTFLDECSEDYTNRGEVNIYKGN